MILAHALMILFVCIACTDGLYYHVYKYRLYARPESRYEHLLHTVNVCLFLPQCFLFFCVRPHGAFLWAALATFFATLGVEIADVLSENESRKQLGGVVPLEYLMHFLMSGLRAGFLSAYMVAAGSADLYVGASLGPPALPYVGWFVLGPGALVAAFHVWLHFVGGRAALTSPSRAALRA